MSSPSTLDRPDGFDGTHNTRLPTFAPIRHPNEEFVRAESSRSGSYQSVSHDGDQDQTSLRNGSSSYLNSPRDQPDPQTLDVAPRRNKKRSSGGFLLDPFAQSTRPARSVTRKLGHGIKGKRRSTEDSDLSIPKRRMKENGIRPVSAAGTSPLAKELKPDAVYSNEPSNGEVYPGTDVRHSPSQRQTGTVGRQPTIKRDPIPIVGYETDPSQIVSMALSLSEGRRRQASMRKNLSGPVSGNRAVSSPNSPAYNDTPVIGSLAQYLTPRSQNSQNWSPKQRPTTPQTTSAISTLDDEAENDVASDDMFDEEISQATQARVQRAKTFFELAYEHRRLLSHLPPVRRPGTQVKDPSLDSSSKAYNPLQYIRNRKLRIWDKTSINAEVDGWHDIGKVREWVDTVITGHRDTRHDPDECIRLPPLAKASSNMDESESDASKPRLTPRPTDLQMSKPRRPRSDWMTHPGDMIADCFWLEQGMNKIKIQDRDNNQIYPPNTQFRFSGWRNRTPMEVPSELQEPTPPPEEVNRQSSQSPAPALPTFQSARLKSKRDDQTRKRDKFKKSITTRDDDNIHRKGLRIFMDDSDSDPVSSESSDDLDDSSLRGRKRTSRQDKKVAAMHDDKVRHSEAETRPQFRDTLSGARSGIGDNSQSSSTANSKRVSMDQSRLSRLLKRESRVTTPNNRSLTREEVSRTDSIMPFPAFDDDNPRNSIDYDSTAPSSPINTRWPSIAIKLESPPHSRSPSPTKKARSSILSSLKDRIHDRHEKVQTADFADDVFRNSSKSTPVDSDKREDSSDPASRGTSPMTRGKSPMSKNRINSQHDLTPAPAEHRESTVSRVSSKTNSSSVEPGRIRGMFKGGRIAELVGNEVSRVGDFIWKRDVPAHVRNRGSTSDASFRSSQASDSEGETRANGTVLKTPQRPEIRRSRSSTISSTKTDGSSPTFTRTSPQTGNQSKYYNPNLPTFTSPFQEDKDRQEKVKDLLTPTSSPPQDHISQMAAQHRSISKSPRLDKLAPPKLNTTRPSTPDGLPRQSTYGFTSGLDLSRSKDASGKYNSAINSAGVLKGSKSAIELSRTFGASNSIDLKQEAASTNVTRRDISRAEALILSNAVKAREIARRADAPRTKTPNFLLNSIDTRKKDLHTLELSQVRRREEHIIAARNIMATLSGQASELSDKLGHFNHSTVPSLHTDLQTLEDMVENKITPRVRITADEAGELSMKLITTSTLAVKELNDLIENALRERRVGPIRWARRLWYTGVEWTVVAMLWLIWAVVTLIRAVLAALGGTVRVTKWLLWLN